MVRLERVEKSFGGKIAVAETSLTVERGERLALLGTSGSGKSTLLRMVVGLVVPDRGAVTIHGTRMEPKHAEEIRRRIGYVIQEGGLFPHLTARANVELLARHLGTAAAKIEARVDELTKLVRIDPDLLDRYPYEMSGGQRQRVALMRALMLDPDLLLLDEPLGALDPIVRSELQADLLDVFRSLEKTVILVTHDVGEAAFLATDIALMRAGSIVQRGALRDLADAPREPFVSEFLKAQRARWIE